MDHTYAADVGDFGLVCGDLEEYIFEDGEEVGEIIVEEIHSEISEDNAAEDDEFQQNVEFVRNQKAKNTVRKTDRDAERFITFLQERGVLEPPEKLECRTLAKYLSTYIREITRVDGGLYEPDSIGSIYGSLDRYLRDRDYSEHITESAAFKGAREMLEAKKKFLKACGKGNKPNRAQPLSADEIEMLWTNGGFGLSNPEEMTAAVWYTFCIQFGFRGNHEMKQLKYGDIEVRMDEKGYQFLEFTERLTKTRTGGVGSATSRPYAPKAWETGDDRCPVKIYNTFNSRKPAQMRQDGAPFLVAINHRRIPNSPIWYSRGPLGHNEISKILSKAGIRAGIERILTNHAVCKTSITTLVQSGIPMETIAQHSGHKSSESLKHYAIASIEQQRNMSRILHEKSINPSSTKTRQEEENDAAVDKAVRKKLDQMKSVGRERMNEFKARIKRRRLEMSSEEEETIPSSQPHIDNELLAKSSSVQDDIPTQVYSEGKATRPKILVPDSESEDSEEEFVPGKLKFPAKLEKNAKIDEMMKGMIMGNSNVRDNVFHINISI